MKGTFAPLAQKGRETKREGEVERERVVIPTTISLLRDLLAIFLLDFVSSSCYSLATHATSTHYL